MSRSTIPRPSSPGWLTRTFDKEANTSHIISQPQEHQPVKAEQESDWDQDVCVSQRDAPLLAQDVRVATNLRTNGPPQPITKLKVLMAEDDASDIKLVLRTLQSDGFEVSCDLAETAEDFVSRIKTDAYDVILADYNLPKWKGIEALEVLRRENLDVPLIVVTSSLSQEKAMECIKQGAIDCVMKDYITRLPASIRRALEEKKMRDQRRKSEMDLASKIVELARSNAELEQFAYVASHDLQEPLRMIANYTQLLGERYRGQLDSQADKYIAYAVDGAVRMQALIQDLLKFSRLGNAEIELTNTDCNKVIEQALTNLQIAIQESGADIKFEKLPTVMADASQLTQVFQNLIANAIKFHGTSAPSIQIKAEDKEREWVFSISDNGIGIPYESWQDIFVIFRRLHTRAQYAGNGIGLAICKKIVERHGGRLWLESQSQPGACFKFSLPSKLLTNQAPEIQ